MHFGILSYFIKLPSVIMSVVLSVFEEPFYTGFNVFLAIMTCNASICIMDHPDLTVSNLMGSSMGKKWLLRKVLNRK